MVCMEKGIFEIWELDEQAKAEREKHDRETVARARAAAMKRDVRLLRYFANKYKQERNDKAAKTAYQKINNLRKSAYREYREYGQNVAGDAISDDVVRALFPPIMTYPAVAGLIPAE